MSLMGFYETVRAYENDGRTQEAQRSRLGLSEHDRAQALFMGASRSEKGGPRQLVGVFSVMRGDVAAPEEIHVIQADTSEHPGLAIAQREADIDSGYADGVLRVMAVNKQELEVSLIDPTVGGRLGSIMLEDFDLHQEIAAATAMASPQPIATPQQALLLAA